MSLSERGRETQRGSERERAGEVMDCLQFTQVRGINAASSQLRVLYVVVKPKPKTCVSLQDPVIRLAFISVGVLFS